MGMWDGRPRREAQGDGAAVVLEDGKPIHTGKGVSVQTGGEVRDDAKAETWRSPLPRTLHEPVAPKGARAVQGGADGKVFTEHASRLLP